VRLNLLALLAYLDDTLDPTQARLVGQQVADSVAARDLVDRIQMLLRDRQIGVPAGGERLDPNLLGAFLDGKLSPERAREVEESILASDAALAEVAACHQAVAGFRANPETVPLAPRQRMYELVRGQEGVPRRRESAEAVDSPVPKAVGNGLRVRTRRRLSLAFVLAPVAAGLLLLIVAGVIAVQMWPRNNAVVQHSEETPHESSTEHPLASPKESTTPSKPPETTSNPNRTDPEPVKPPPEDPKLREPFRPPEPTRIDVPVIPKPSDEKRELGTYAGAPATIPSLLVQRAGEAGPWRRIAKDAKVSSTAPLVVVPGYTSDLRLDSGVNVSLRSALPGQSPEFPILETVITLHAPEPAFDLDCTVETGRIVITNNKPLGAAHVRLRFLKEIWDLVLKDAQSTAAFEVLGLYDAGVPFSKEPNSLGPSSSANVLAFQGQVDLKVRYQSFSLPTPSLCGWKDTEGRFKGAQKLQQLPHWFTDPGLPKNQYGRDHQLALEDIATQSNNKPVEVVLLEARTERKPIPRELAILAAGALDDLGALADALADEKDQFGRYVATFTLRWWCGRGPENAAKLYKFLYEKKGYSKPQAEMILELFSMPAESLDDPDTWDKLIGRLRHDKLAIRHLSHWQLCQFVPDGQKIPYNASDGSDARDRAYEAWKKLIPDGKVPPKPGTKR
jgi:hypothetical protein